MLRLPIAPLSLVGLALLAVALPVASAHAQDASADLPHWDFEDKDLDWELLPGTTGKLARETDAGIVERGKACLRWEYQRESDTQEFHGIRISGLTLTESEHLRISFRIRAQGVESLLFSATTLGGVAYHAQFSPALDGWREVHLSTEALSFQGEGDAPGFIAPTEIDQLTIWAGEARPLGVTTVWIDDVRFERDPDRLPPLPKTKLRTIPARHDFAIGLDFATLGTPERALPALKEARRMGFSMVEVLGDQWSGIEKHTGAWDWVKLDALAAASREADMKWVADVGGIINIIYDNRVHTPADVRFDGDFKKLLPRYTGFIDEFFERYADLTRCFLFHTEKGGEYFADHPQQLRSYAEFLRASIVHVKKRGPGVKTGVCLELDESPELFKVVNAHADVCSVLFSLPAEKNHSSHTADRFLHALRLAGTKQIALNEVGRTSSMLTGSSEEEQAAFVRELFVQLRRHRGRVAWVTWWCLHDDTASGWQDIGEHIIGGQGAAATWIRELRKSGLLRSPGVPKPSAFAWIEGMRSLGR